MKRALLLSVRVPKFKNYVSTYKLDVDHTELDQVICFAHLYCFNRKLIIVDIECSNNGTDGVVSGTSCGIPSDVIQHKCGIRYQGSTPPIIRWVDLEGNLLEHSVQSQMNSTGVMESMILQTSISWASRNGIRCQLLHSKRSCLSRYESHC